MEGFYDLFIDVHVVCSILFFISGIVITIHSLLGWIKQLPYARFATWLHRTFLALLYLDLFLGIVLYFFLKKPDAAISAAEAIENASLRFWAIQHFSNMVLVALLCIIGQILIQKTHKSVTKYKYSFGYFGFSTAIIILSVGVFMVR